MFSFHRADGPSWLKASNHGNLIEQVEQLLEQWGVTAPPSSGAAWGQIVDYADKNGHPILYAPVLAGNGVKLACTDADTQATAIAWAADKIQTDSYLRMGRTDGDMNWDSDPGNGEHLTMTPGERQHALAVAVADAYPDVTVVIQAYGMAAIPPAQVDPRIGVVVMGAYLPHGETVQNIHDQWVANGATRVWPYVYGDSWYRGEPGASIMHRPERMLEELTRGRVGVNAVDGEFTNWWAANAPAYYAFVRALDLPSSEVTLEVLDYLRREFMCRVWPDSIDEVAAFYAHLDARLPYTEEWCRDGYVRARAALNASSPGVQKDRACIFVHHIHYCWLRLNWLNSQTQTDKDALIDWIWSVCDQWPALDLRLLSIELGFSQGGPDPSVTVDSSVGDPATMSALCNTQIAAIPPLSWTPETYPPPVFGPEPSGSFTPGAIGYWVEGHSKGRMWLGADANGDLQARLKVYNYAQLDLRLLDTNGVLIQTITVSDTLTEYSLSGFIPYQTLELEVEDDLQILPVSGEGLKWTHTPDSTGKGATAGSLRGYIKVRSDVTELGFYGRAGFAVWDPDDAATLSFNDTSNAVYVGTQDGYHTVPVKSSWWEKWLPVAASSWVCLYGADGSNSICRWPKEGPCQPSDSPDVA